MEIDAIFDNPNITYDIINKYNEYFSNLEEKYQPPTEDKLHEILEKFSKYLLNISFINNNLYLRIVLLDKDGMNRINDIKLNLINIINYASYLSDNIDEITTELKIKISENICNGVFIIYQYYYVHIHSEKLEFKLKSFRPNLSKSYTQTTPVTLSFAQITKSRHAKTLGGSIIDIEMIKLLINNMLKRNTLRFNNKLNDFITNRIEEINKKEDLYHIFLKNNINLFESKKTGDIFEDNLMILYYITIIEFNKLFYNTHDDDFLTYPMDKAFVYNIKTGIFVKYIRQAVIKKGHNNAFELLNNKVLLQDNDNEILELKDILSGGLILLIDNYELLRINSETFITIPQYEPICWFISMITCMTYSDRNKKLLIQKQIINTENIKTMSNIKDYDSKIIFVSFIYYIIETITSKFKTYSKLTDDCELFIILKETPILFLTKLIEEYKDRLLAEIDDDIVNIKEDKQFSLIRSFINSIFLTKPKQYITDEEKIKHLRQKCKDKIIDNLGCVTNFIYKKIHKYNESGFSMKIDQSNYSIIKLLYGFLNIDCLYVFKIDSKLYKLIEDEYDDDSDIDIKINLPDVIIIDSSYIINSEKKIKENIKRNTIEITEYIEHITNKNIKYNGEIYEIDYILHGTDNNETCEKCGHCISNIHYNNEEYYYNSVDSVKSLNCSESRIRIPCSLIKQEWKTKIDTEQCYKLPNCNYVREYKHKNLNQGVKKFIANSSDDKVCFSSNVNIRICYVKQSLLGGNKKRTGSKI